MVAMAALDDSANPVNRLLSISIADRTWNGLSLSRQSKQLDERYDGERPQECRTIVFNCSQCPLQIPSKGYAFPKNQAGLCAASNWGQLLYNVARPTIRGHPPLSFRGYLVSQGRARYAQSRRLNRTKSFGKNSGSTSREQQDVDDCPIDRFESVHDLCLVRSSQIH